MSQLLRHNGILGVLSALVVVVLVHGNMIGYRLQVPGQGSTHLADTAFPSPSQNDGDGHRLAIPFCATVPATYPEQLRLTAFDGTTASKSHLSDTHDSPASSARAYSAAHLSGGMLLSRTHLFCVYRL